jgi:hypothetical protein
MLYVYAGCVIEWVPMLCAVVYGQQLLFCHSHAHRCWHTMMASGFPKACACMCWVVLCGTTWCFPRQLGGSVEAVRSNTMLSWHCVNFSRSRPQVPTCVGDVRTTCVVQIFWQTAAVAVVGPGASGLCCSRGYLASLVWLFACYGHKQKCLLRLAEAAYI